MRILFLFAIIMSLSTHLVCQTFYLSTQAEIDQFDVNIRYINGSLRIFESPQTNDPITDLSRFSLIDSISGELVISGCSSLTSIDGFTNLKKVGDQLKIFGNSKVSEITGFNELNSINWFINIVSNDSLRVIDAFEKLPKAFGIDISSNVLLTNIIGFDQLVSLDHLEVSGNPRLINMSGFSKLISAAHIEIDGNRSLKSLTSLSNITQITQELYIVGNDSLVAIDGFFNIDSLRSLFMTGNNSLRHIDGFSKIRNMKDISIIYNARLQNIDGFARLEVLGDALNISSNDSLSNIAGLSNLATVGRTLSITANSQLKTCCPIIRLLEDPLSVGNGNIRIQDNAPGCNSPSEIILTECPGSMTAKGRLYFDVNMNGCDTTDVGFTDFSFQSFINGQQTQHLSNGEANYNILLENGLITIVPILPNNKLAVSPDTLILNWPQDSLNLFQDFCVTALESYQDLAITIIPINQARPGFDADYQIQYQNKGSSSVSGSLQLTYPMETTTILSSTPSPNQTMPDMLSWSYDDLNPFEIRTIDFTLRLNSPMDTPPLNGGDLLMFAAEIEPSINDDNILDNQFELNQTVVNSYDPNDKTCLQGTSLDSELIGEYVDYIIRFENTGNASAIHVEIKDTIDLQAFDINSLVVSSVSHPCKTIIENNIVTFSFHFINLPANDDMNDGFITFKIKSRNDLFIGSILENKADIYFDYNFPIETNTAMTEIGFVSTSVVDKSSAELHVFPSPCQNELFVKFDRAGKHRFSLLQMNGQVSLNGTIEGDMTNTLDVQSLTDGLYMMHVIDENGLITTSKFLKISD